MAIFDVPATELIDAVAEDLKGKVKQPEWAEFVKTGRHNERAPHRRDWFYVRMASVLYRVYKNGQGGTNRLRTYYGGRKNRGVRPHRFFRASGKVIRVSLQELEKLGYLKKERIGRSVSPQGQSYLAGKAKEVRKVLGEKAAKEAEIETEERKARAARVEKAAKEIGRKAMPEPMAKETAGAKEKAVEKKEPQPKQEKPVEQKEQPKEEEKKAEEKATGDRK